VSYRTIEISIENGLASLMLNRPEKHNALNAEMIEELSIAFQNLSAMDEVRAIILSGKGKSFCAGADLNYMKNAAVMSREESIDDSLKLASLFELMYRCEKPLIALVHGSAYGGANGLYAVADIVLAAENTVFSFSEVRLGIAPAVIAPYIVKRTGASAAMELMITAKRFDAQEAKNIGLINHALPQNELKAEADQIIAQLFKGAPKAISATKKLIQKITDKEDISELQKYTAALIADLRRSEEGQEGMNAFLEKRKPIWQNQSNEDETL